MMLSPIEIGGVYRHTIHGTRWRVIMLADAFVAKQASIVVFTKIFDNGRESTAPYAMADECFCRQFEKWRE